MKNEGTVKVRRRGANEYEENERGDRGTGRERTMTKSTQMGEVLKREREGERKKTKRGKERTEFESDYMESGSGKPIREGHIYQGERETLYQYIKNAQDMHAQPCRPH